MIRAIQRASNHWRVYESDSDEDEWSIWTLLGDVRAFGVEHYAYPFNTGVKVKIGPFPSLGDAMRALGNIK